MAPAGEGSQQPTPALQVSLGTQWMFVDAGKKKPFPALHQKQMYVCEPVKTATDLPKSWWSSPSGLAKANEVGFQ